jgi:hypothetical protein
MPSTTPEEQQIRLAILEDRQNRYESATLTILGKLDTIERNVSALRDEHYQQIDKLHERITAEKNKAHDEIWDAIHRTESRMDSGRMWLIGALAAALSALVISLLTHPIVQMAPK